MSYTGIPADTLVGAIKLDEITESGEKSVLLPGRSSMVHAISGKQEKVIAGWVVATQPPTVTWAYGVDSCRNHFGVKGDSRDFGLVDKIVQSGRDPHKDLSAAQLVLLSSLIAVLSGTEVHWHKPIADKVAATPASVKSALLGRLILVDTMGQFQRGLDMFTALFGSIPKREERPTTSVDDLPVIDDEDDSPM